MASEAFNINNLEVVKFTNKLEKIHKSAMPVAVRGTLNDAAFLMKSYKLPAHFKNNFTIRKKTFLRSHTAVLKSKNTFIINQMSSEVGIIKGKSEAGDDLINQEYGGRVGNRDYISTKESRVSKSKKKLVRKANKIINSNKKIYKGKSFIKKAYKAGEGGYVRHKKWIFRINTISKKGQSIRFKTTPVYTFKKNRQVKIERSPFFLPATNETVRLIPHLFVKRAKERLKRENIWAG